MWYGTGGTVDGETRKKIIIMEKRREKEKQVTEERREKKKTLWMGDEGSKFGEKTR